MDFGCWFWRFSMKMHGSAVFWRLVEKACAKIRTQNPHQNSDPISRGKSTRSRQIALCSTREPFCLLYVSIHPVLTCQNMREAEQAQSCGLPLRLPRSEVRFLYRAGAETPQNFREDFLVSLRTILSAVDTQTAVLVSTAKVWISTPDT